VCVCVCVCVCVRVCVLLPDALTHSFSASLHICSHTCVFVLGTSPLFLVGVLQVGAIIPTTKRNDAAARLYCSPQAAQDSRFLL
jgi:hypothetical protein